MTKDLMEVLEDGKDGFAHAANKLDDSDRADLAPRFREFSEQRAALYRELENLAAAYGDDVEESGSAKGSLHRAWISVKDALTGSDPEGVLAAAENGEDHAVKAYREALEKDLSPDLRLTVEAQFTKIRTTHDAVKAMRNASK